VLNTFVLSQCFFGGHYLETQMTEKKCQSADAPVFLNGSDLFLDDGSANTERECIVVKWVMLSLARDTS